MKKMRIAICDTEIAYGSMLAQYLMETEAERCEVCVYTRRELLLEDLELVGMDVILCASDFWTRELQDKLAQDHGKSTLIMLNDGSLDVDCDVPRRINKYQSAQAVMRQVYELVSGDLRESRGIEKNKQLIGVFAPWQQELSMMFSMTLAQTIAKSQKVLYISLLECSGFQSLLGEEYEYDLADALALVETTDKNRYAGICGMVYQMGQADYIPPMCNPQNATEITGKEVLSLLNVLLEQGDYEVIILETGAMIAGLYEMLAECDCVYSPFHENRIQQSRQRQVLDRIRMEGCESLADRILSLRVPRINVQSLSQENFAEQLLWSELGNYIREQITGEQAAVSQQRGEACYGQSA